MKINEQSRKNCRILNEDWNTHVQADCGDRETVFLFIKSVCVIDTSDSQVKSFLGHKTGESVTVKTNASGKYKDVQSILCHYFPSQKPSFDVIEAMKNSIHRIWKNRKQTQPLEINSFMFIEP